MVDKLAEIEISKKPSNDNNGINNKIKYIKHTDIKEEKETYDLDSNNRETSTEFVTNKTNSQEILEDNSKLEQLIDDLGISWYNIRIYAVLSIFYLADGAEMIVISLLISKLSGIWNLSHTQKGIAGSAVFLGFFFGALFSGKLADNRGRKPIFVIGSLIMLIFAFMSALSPNYTTLLILRAINGFGIGLSIPSLTALTTEVTPSKYRSLVLNLVFLCFPLGEIFSVMIAREVLENDNGWRYLLGFVAIPTIVVFTLSLFIFESPKYYLGIKDYEKGFNEINRMLKYKNLPELTEDKKEELIKENEASSKTKISSSYMTLFKKEYIGLLIKISLIYYICSFIYYGLVYILPQIMESLVINNSKNNIPINTSNSTALTSQNHIITREERENIYQGIIISSLSEFPTIILSAFLANFKPLGRKGSLALGLALTFISSIICGLTLDSLVVSASLLKSAINIPFNIIYLYTQEAFPTKIRSTAHGVCSSFNRLGGISTPIISQYAFSFSNSMPFYFFAIISSVGLILSLILPFETLGRRIN